MEAWHPDPGSSIRNLILGDYPALLSMEQVAQACGRSHVWAYERARRSEIPVKRTEGRMVVAKLELIGWLAGEYRQEVFNALFGSTADPQAADLVRQLVVLLSPTPTENPHA